MRVLRYLSMFLLGAGAAFYFDPARGKTRRARVRDKSRRVLRETMVTVGKVQADWVNRGRGIVLDKLHALEEGTISDEVIRERVRARLGHVAEEPHKIQINVIDGRVVVSGNARAHEVSKIMHAIKHVRGVVHVEERLGPRQLQSTQ